MTANFLRAALALALLAIAACSEPAKTTVAAKEPEKKEPAAPPEPVTAKTAFYGMYKPARAWSTDVQPLSLVSGDVPALKGETGKAAMWTAVFVSLSKRAARTYYYSAIDQLPTMAKGIKAGPTVAWGGPTTEVMPFELSDFKVDSDAAYQTAFTKGEAWVKKHPGKSASFTLGNASRFTAPVWYVMWGDKTSGYAAYVNATSGSLAGGK
jgi:hypothetical protein